MRVINKIIVHCSDSEFGDSKIIDKWHKERGFNSIGYHYVILNGATSSNSYDGKMDGKIEFGRQLSEAGAHCSGQNSDSIGICLIGKNKFTQHQFFSLQILVEYLRLTIKQDLSTYGHNYYNALKTCPNFRLEDVL